MGQRIGIGWLQHVDGICQFCRRGRENLCRDSRYTGYDVDGGYAEYAVVPEDFAYELPEGVNDERVSPLLCAGLIGYRALQLAAVPEKARLLLVGFGEGAQGSAPVLATWCRHPAADPVDLPCQCRSRQNPRTLG